MYRWVITYSGNDKNDERRPDVKGPWVISKRICMKNFFNALSENPELLSTFTSDMNEIVYLDRRIQKKDKDQASIVIYNPRPFSKYQLFKWKVRCFSALPGNAPAVGGLPEWTHKKRRWTSNYKTVLTEFGHLNYDLVDSWGSREYLYMRRRLPCFERIADLAK